MLTKVLVYAYWNHKAAHHTASAIVQSQSRLLHVEKLVAEEGAHHASRQL